MNKEKIINIGGINGLGEGLINLNSKDFKDLQSIIKHHSSNQEEEKKMENEFLSIRFQMESYLNNVSDQIVLAGEFIEKYLKVIKVKKKDFASYIKYEESNLSALLKGRRKVNTDLAIKLGKIFKLNPVIWLNIENKNELLREVKGKEEDYQNYSLKDLLKKAG